MKHALLKRQIRKYLPEHLKDQDGLEAFFASIDRSYNNYDEKLVMLQRAMAISSQELHTANLEIEKEVERQRNILASLEKAIFSLQLNLGDLNFQRSGQENLSPENLANKIITLAEELRHVSNEKNQLLKELEEQNTALNDYAHMVSHDLKSPIRNINALMAWIKEDEKGSLSLETNKKCELISKNLDKMDQLIDGILKHSTMGRTMESSVKFDLSSCLDDILGTIYVPGNITVKKAKGLPIVYLPKKLVEQLFLNLFTNAIAATNGIKKGIISVAYQDKEGFWEFSVSDNGKGIAKKHQKGVFEMFTKLDNNDSSIGMGLALVKKIINLLNGEIWIESEVGKGTTFHFTIKK